MGLIVLLHLMELLEQPILVVAEEVEMVIMVKVEMEVLVLL